MEGDRCFTSHANTTQDRWLLLPTMARARFSPCGRSRPTEKAVTGAVDTAVPESHRILMSDAYLGLEINGAKWNLHASQPVSLNTGVDSPSSFTVILQVGGKHNHLGMSATPVINWSRENGRGVAKSPRAGLDRAAAHSGSDTSSFRDPGKVTQPPCPSGSPSLNWRFNNLLHRAVLELRLCT